MRVGGIGCKKNKAIKLLSNLFVSLKKGWGGREGRGKKATNSILPNHKVDCFMSIPLELNRRVVSKGREEEEEEEEGGEERERGGEWKESTKGESILSSRDRSFVLSASFQSFVVYHNLLIAKNGFHHIIHCSQWKVERSSALVDRRRDRTWNICFPVV